MEGDLIDVGRWLLGPGALPVLDAASVSLVRSAVRGACAEAGLSQVPAESLVNVASELANNQLRHARAGMVEVRLALRGTDRGVEVIAADAGPGITDVAMALLGQPRPTGSLGVGLAGALELSHELDLDTRLGEGTCVHARIFERTDVRRRRVGIFGRPHPHETTSGDEAGFVRTRAGLVVFVADGLGHGFPARQAALCVRDVVTEHAELPLDAILQRCDAVLARTRGAVVAVGRIDDDARCLTLASVGNVTAQVVGAGGAHKLGGTSHFLGAAGGIKTIRVERRELAPRDAVVLFSDGLSSRVDLGPSEALWIEHPAVTAQRLGQTYGAERDDVTVLVAC